jgi:hypothetical protein
LKRYLFGLASAAVATFGLASACGSSGSTSTCDCNTPTITIAIPIDVAASASAPELSGAACTNVKAVCTNPTSGCAQYEFEANAAGTCEITVPLGNTVFTTSITIISNSGCCSGFFPADAGAANVIVPEPGPTEDGGTD